MTAQTMPGGTARPAHTTHSGETAQRARAAAETTVAARKAPHVRLRRLLVTLGVVASLVVAGITVRAASIWAASEAPLTVAPVSVESVEMALAQEKSRSAILEDQIAALQSSAGDLTGALSAAGTRLATDQATADELRASLAAAQAKLAKLEAALAAQAKAAAAHTTTRSTSGGSDDGGGVDD
jgi:septal ring factor EnvC (AmiA/AmiB activator)